MNLLDLIDTRQGTNNQNSFSHGNTLPYTTVPFGMNAFVHQTRNSDVRYFNAHDRTSFGIRLTHQPSPWMGDYAFLVFNVFGLTPEETVQLDGINDPELIENLSRSSYNPDYSTFKPHYVSYTRLRDAIEMELIPTTYGASFRANNISETNYMTVSISATGKLEVSEDGTEVTGYTDQLSGSKYNNYGMYFNFKAKNNQFRVVKQTKHFNGEHLMEMYWLELTDTEGKENLEFDLTTSFINLEQAEVNYTKDSFYTLDWNEKKTFSGDRWLAYLEKIDVEHSDFELVKTFYTSLYRTATFPQRAYEINADDEKVHFSPYTGRVEKGHYYLNNGYWDTFRTNYPLYAILIPDYIPHFIEGIMNIAREDKYLPKWTSPDERGLMPGTLVDAVIADAVVKGLVDEALAEELLDAMIFTATTASDNELEGREDADFYFEKGYIPAETVESVNKTLDFAFSDFCIAQVASTLGKEAIAAEYYESSLNYRNLFDEESKLMKPRAANGERLEPFAEHRWGEHYTEGSAFQNSFSVFHNIGDLIELHGGDQAFYGSLLKLVNMDATFEAGGFGQEIHEMSEMAMLQFGQLAISNQPSFHIPYLFTYAGYPNVSQLLLKQLMLNVFDSSADGFPGDEDNGSLSAWFILSSLGLYAVTPGTKEYVLGISIWDKATIHLDNGEKIQIQSNPQEPYLTVVNSRQVNKEPYEKDYILYEDLMAGLDIKQHLGVIPSITPTKQENRPFSLNQKQHTKDTTI